MSLLPYPALHERRHMSQSTARPGEPTLSGDSADSLYDLPQKMLHFDKTIL
jgi:hypothetical protein